MNFDRAICQLSLAASVTDDNLRMARSTGNMKAENECAEMLAELTEAARVLEREERNETTAD